MNANQSLDRRIAQLERSHRRYRIAVVILGLFGAVLVLGGAGSRNNLEAASLHITDRSGKTRIELSTQASGNPQFLLFDKSKRVRMKADLQNKGQPTIVLYAADKKPRAMITTDQRGRPSWILYDKAQKARATLALREDGSGVLFFSDKHGKVKSILPRVVPF